MCVLHKGNTFLSKYKVTACGKECYVYSFKNMANIYSMLIFSFLDLYLNIIVSHIHNSNCLTQTYFPLQFLEDKQKRHAKSLCVTKHPVCIYAQHIYAVSTVYINLCIWCWHFIKNKINILSYLEGLNSNTKLPLMYFNFEPSSYLIKDMGENNLLQGSTTLSMYCPNLCDSYTE